MSSDWPGRRRAFYLFSAIFIVLMITFSVKMPLQLGFPQISLSNICRALVIHPSTGLKQRTGKLKCRHDDTYLML